MKNERLVLLVTTVVGWYNVGVIWLLQRHVLPGFEFIGSNEWPEYHGHHWQAIKYVVLAPAGLAFAGSALLNRLSPDGVPRWATRFGLALQTTAFGLTAVVWGPMQVQLDREGNAPKLVGRFVRTHWIRTALVTLFGLLTLGMAVANGESDRQRPE